MPELPKLEVVRDDLSSRIVGQTSVSAELNSLGGPIVIRDLAGEDFAPGLTAARSASDPRGPAAA